METTKVILELEIKGNARSFIEGLIEDYYYIAKGEALLLEQYESIKYTIKEVK